MILRIALALRDGGEIPWRYMRWHLVYKLGWTLEQVDALSLGDLLDKQIYDKGLKRKHEITK